MSNTGKVILGVIGGIAVGAAAGVLFAPSSGKETRQDIAKAVDELKAKIADLLEQGEDLASEKVNSMIKKLSRMESEITQK